MKENIAVFLSILLIIQFTGFYAGKAYSKEITSTKAEDKYSKVIEADTKIAMAPTIVTEINNYKNLIELLSKKHSATAILTINKKLEVLGTGFDIVIGSVETMCKLIKPNIIPAFRVNDSETAYAISSYLKNNEIEDVFVISNKPELVKQARENYTLIRGIVEFDSVPLEASISDLMHIRDITNSNLSRIAVIPAESATKSNIQYLRQRLITVWTKETISEDTTDIQLIALHKMITAGSDGIVTNSPQKARQALSVYNHKTTIIRKPFLIGHRGVPNLAPENTIEGGELAFELGADTIEKDIHITKVGADGERHLVIMHDETINRTTNGAGEIANMTMEKLGQYYVNKQFPRKYPAAKIPTLKKYFEKFRERDQVLFAEIKSYDPQTIDRYTEMVKEMDYDEHIVTISFDENQLKRTKDLMPEMSIGYLCSGIVNESDVYGSLRNALWQIQTINATIMTDYSGVGKEFIEVSKHRGMGIWSWTFTDRNTIIKYFKMGISGLTVNCVDLFSDWAADIKPKQSQVYIEEGKSIPLYANIETYSGKIKEVVPDIVILSGEGIVRANGNKLTSTASGVAYVTLRYTAKLSGNEGDTYDIYTQPIKIQIGETDYSPTVENL